MSPSIAPQPLTIGKEAHRRVPEGVPVHKNSHEFRVASVVRYASHVV